MSSQPTDPLKTAGESECETEGGVDCVECVELRGQGIRVGSRVRLRPGVRRTDAQDMFLSGRTASVHRIRQDVAGQIFLAVTVDDDPAAELLAWRGLYHYFSTDEVEPL